MSNTIKDGKGSSKLAEVTDNGLKTDSTNNSAQHVISRLEDGAFQVEGEIDIAATEKTVLTLMNNNKNKNVVVTFIRIMSIGAAAADENAYFNLKLGGERSSGGTLVTPVNMKSNSAVVPTTISYEGSGTDLVITGTVTQIDRNYSANTMQSYSKDGALILNKNTCMSITHKGSTVAGKAYCRISFYMEDKVVEI